MKLIYEELIPANRQQFVAAVVKVAALLGVDPNALMVVFYIETYASKYKKINHLIVNSLGYRGLLQFSAANIKALGYTVQTFEALTNYEQVEQLVYNYLKPYRNRLKCLADIYLAVLFPVAIGKPDSFVLEFHQLTAQKVAINNPSYDINKDLKITVLEVKQRLLEYIPKNVNIK